MKKILLFTVVLMPALFCSAATVNYIWANKGSNMNDPSNYYLSDGETVSSALPTKDDRIFFVGQPIHQPYLNETLEVRSICFGPIGSNGRTNVSKDDSLDGYNHSGWEISGEPDAKLILPQSWSEGNNWNFAFSQASFGTNIINVAVDFTSTSENYRPIMPSGGRMIFKKPVSCTVANAWILVSGSDNGCVEFAAPNLDLKCGILVSQNMSLVFSHKEAIYNVWRIRLNNTSYHSYIAYGTISQTFENQCGEAVTLPNLLEIDATAKQTSCIIGGSDMHFPNAVMRTPYNDSKLYSFDVNCTVKSLQNSIADSGEYLFGKYGVGTLTVLEDIFTEAPEGQTNGVVIIDGSLHLKDPSHFSRGITVFGEGGYFFEWGARPVIGLEKDMDYVRGKVGGNTIITYRDRSYLFGWAAYGADRRVNLFGEPFYKFTTSGDSISYAKNGNWFQDVRTFIFGAKDSDATIIFENGIDVDVSNSHWSANSRGLYAVKGKAFVDARIMGVITNANTGANSYCRIHKYGDGVIAYEGEYYLSRGDSSEIAEGGLLINDKTEKSNWQVLTNAWLGGKGRIVDGNITVKTGGGIRGGEQIGDFTISSNLTMENGSKFIVDVGNEGNGCVYFAGDSKTQKSNGNIVVRLEPIGEITKANRVKFLDWSEATNPKSNTLFDPSIYSVEFDEEIFSKANITLGEDGTSMWITYFRGGIQPTMLLVY